MMHRAIHFCCFFLLIIPVPFCKGAPPNVLFIAIDDLRTDLACYGNSQIISPNIDALATVGTLFNRAYCQQAVCNPSRSSLLTGFRLNTLNIWDLPTHFRQRRPDAITIPQMFLNNGYHTQCIGKIFHNWRQDEYKGDRVSWSVKEILHYNSHGNDRAVVDGELPPDLSDVPKCEIRDVPDNAYFDGRVAEHAVKALQEHKDEPFFLAIGFWKPHSHFNAPKPYWDLYDPAAIQLPENPEPPVNAPAIALHDSREILRAYANTPGMSPTQDQSREMRRGYYANISYMDKQVGKVLAELDRLDLRKNTIIILWSDHGFHLGEKGLWAKTSNFELDARVPMIISTPQYNREQKTNAIVELLDIYPTLADLCDLQPPPGIEGRSLVPILNNPRQKVKDAALTQHCRPAYPASGADPEAMGYSIRTARYRYTEWRDFRSGDVLARELYDHKKDPDESVNVIDQSGANLRNKLAEALKSIVP